MKLEADQDNEDSEEADSTMIGEGDPRRIQPRSSSSSSTSTDIVVEEKSRRMRCVQSGRKMF